MEIPVLLHDRTVGTHVESMSRECKTRCKRERSAVGKSAAQSEGVMRSEDIVVKHVSHVPRKAAIAYAAPVP